MSVSTQHSFESELELATRVQRSLLPKPSCCMHGWELSFSYEAARQVSGDYIDLINTDPDAFYFILGDVSGKGVAAALLMAHLHATVRMLVTSGLNLDRIVRETSSTFCHSSLPAQFVTLVIGRATNTGEVELINAGQTPVLFVHESKTKQLPATEVPLGLFCGMETGAGSTASRERALQGDTLLLYSDGVTETNGVDGSEYGVRRLQDLLSCISHDSPEETIAAVLRDLRSFSAESELSDDRSLLALRFRGALRSSQGDSDGYVNIHKTDDTDILQPRDSSRINED